MLTSLLQAVPQPDRLSGGNIPGLRLFLPKPGHAGRFPEPSRSVLPQLLQRGGWHGGRSRQPGVHPHPHPPQPHPPAALPAGVELGCSLRQHRCELLTSRSSLNPKPQPNTKSGFKHLTHSKQKKPQYYLNKMIHTLTRPVSFTSIRLNKIFNRSIIRSNTDSLGLSE